MLRAMKSRTVEQVLYLVIAIFILGVVHKLYVKLARPVVAKLSYNQNRVSDKLSYNQDRVSGMQTLPGKHTRWRGEDPSSPRITPGGSKQTYLEAIEIIKNAKFTPAEAIYSENGTITVGMVIDGKTVQEMMNTLLMHSSNTPLHFVILARSKYLPSLTKRLSHLITKCLGTWVIISRSWIWRRQTGLPPIHFSFVDMEEIIRLSRPFTQVLLGKSPTMPVNIDTYLGPLYHTVFKSLHKIIFLESDDLIFATDIKLLDDQFSQFTPSEVIGLPPDLSPYYREVLTANSYLTKHPSSKLGGPGKFQGYNLGVVLYNLQAMRENREYAEYINPATAGDVLDKYNLAVNIGAQDWLTAVGFNTASLIYPLPCQFNTQTTLQFFRPPWKSTFHQYHVCDRINNIKIFHVNGCGPTTVDCNQGHIPWHEYQQFVFSFVEVMDSQVFWNILGHRHGH